MQLIQARATANRLVTTKYGEKRVIDAITQDGQQVTLWRPVDDDASKSIVNGSRIQVAFDAKGKASLIESPADRATQPLSLPMEAEMKLKQQIGFIQPESQTPSRSAEIAEYIGKLSKLMNHCQTAANGSESIAIELFRQTVTHFQL